MCAHKPLHLRTERAGGQQSGRDGGYVVGGEGKRGAHDGDLITSWRAAHADLSGSPRAADERDAHRVGAVLIPLDYR